MTFTPLHEERPANPEPSTASKGDTPNETNFTKEAKPQLPKKNPLGQPKNSVLKGMSPLAKFRLSPAYQRIKNKLRHQDTAGDETFTAADLEERAESMIEHVRQGGSLDDLFTERKKKKEEQGEKQGKEGKQEKQDLATSVIAILVDAGFDENLVEVVQKGSSTVLLYVDDRIGEKHKDLRDILSEFATVKLVSKPQDDPDLGVYTYEVTSHGDADVTSRVFSKIPKEVTDVDKTESFTPLSEAKKTLGLRPVCKTHKSTAPQPDTRNKKGQRVMHDRNRNETFTTTEDTCFTVGDIDTQQPSDRIPLKEILGIIRDRFEEAGNSQPKTGDIIVDTRTRRHFEVTRVLTNDRIETRRTTGVLGPDRFVGDAQVERRDVIERGLASGVMRRIIGESADESVGDVPTFSNPFSTCPNCVVPLVEEDDAASCTACGFVAEFDVSM